MHRFLSVYFMSEYWGTIVSRKLKRNISLIYGLSFFQCFMLTVPIIVPFSASKGLSLVEIFYLQAVFAMTLVFPEAPSGYFADLFGRRNALMVGSVPHVLGYLVLNYADNIGGLMAFEIVLGIAASSLWCAQGFTTAITTRIGFGIERRLGAAMTLSLIGILPVVGHIGMAFAPGQAGIVIALMLFAGRGLNQVILVNALNRRVPSEFSATANSFTSFLFRLIFILTGPVIGYVAQLQLPGMALTVIGASYIAVFVMVMIPLIQWVKNIQQRVAA